MEPEPKTYDLVVIGSGPAGEKGAAQAAFFGKSVAIIERMSVVGGASTNTGTLPSKTLRETSLFLSGYKNRDLSGVKLSIEGPVTVRDFMAHEQQVTADERLRVLENLSKHDVHLYRGEGSFLDPRTISVKQADGTTVLLNGKVVLIAVGSSPHRPPMFPFEDDRIYDSDEILDLHGIPKTMLVVGGGVIGCEYACTFAMLGVEVTVLEIRERLLESLDREVSDTLREQMGTIGIQFILGDCVSALDVKEVITVTLKSGQVMTPETILVSAGRGGNTKSLGLENIGVNVDDRGRIRVNESYQTDVPHIYAAGDVIGSPALSSTSMEQARVAMVHAFDLKYRGHVSPILPVGIYTIPEVSMAGETEEALKAKGIEYVSGKATYASNARGHIIGDAKGFLKLLFKLDDMTLVGVHVIGEQATELVHVGLIALLLKQPAELFVQTCFNYPTLTELYKYAAYDAMGKRARALGIPGKSTASAAG